MTSRARPVEVTFDGDQVEDIGVVAGAFDLTQIDDAGEAIGIYFWATKPGEQNYV